MTSAEYNTVRQYFNDFNKDENGHSWVGGEGQSGAGYDPIGTPYVSKNRILLREPESCRECGKVFLSLYILKSCTDHEGLDQG